MREFLKNTSTTILMFVGTPGPLLQPQKSKEESDGTEVAGIVIGIFKDSQQLAGFSTRFIVKKFHRTLELTTIFYMRDDDKLTSLLNYDLKVCCCYLQDRSLVC